MLKRPIPEEALSKRLRTPRLQEENDPLLREVREELAREKARTAADTWTRRRHNVPSDAFAETGRWERSNSK